MVDRVAGVLVGRSVDNTAASAATKHQAEAALRPVVAAGVLADPRRAAHLTGYDHQCRLQQPTIVEVVEQRREHVIEHRQVEPQHVEVVLVRVPVPAVSFDGTLPVKRDERRAGLDQPPGGQQAAAVKVTSVTIADAVGFSGEVERVAGLARRQHLQGPALETAEAIHRPRRFDGGHFRVDLVEQRSTVAETLGSDLGQCVECRQQRISDRLDRIVERALPGELRIADGEQRITASPEVPRVGPGTWVLRMAGNGGHEDVPGNVTAGPTEKLQHRPHAGMIVRLRPSAVVLAAGESREHRVGMVTVVAVSDGPDQRRVVHPTGRSGQVFTDLYARHRRRDRLELATNVRGCLRLQVEHVDVARPAEEVDEHNRLGRCRPIGRRLAAAGCLQEPRQSHRRKQ